MEKGTWNPMLKGTWRKKREEPPSEPRKGSKEAETKAEVNNKERRCIAKRNGKRKSGQERGEGSWRKGQGREEDGQESLEGSWTKRQGTQEDHKTN